MSRKLTTEELRVKIQEEEAERRNVLEEYLNKVIGPPTCGCEILRLWTWVDGWYWPQGIAIEVIRMCHRHHPDPIKLQTRYIKKLTQALEQASKLGMPNEQEQE